MNVSGCLSAESSFCGRVFDLKKIGFGIGDFWGLKVED